MNKPSKDPLEQIQADWQSVMQTMDERLQWQLLMELQDSPSKRLEIQQYLIALGMFFMFKGDKFRADALKDAGCIITAFGISCRLKKEGVIK